jgi:hypothetical protein
MNLKKLAVFTVIAMAFILPLVSAVETPLLQTGSDTWLTESTFYKAVAPYIIPAGSEGVTTSGMGALIIGILAVVVIFAILYDVSELVLPLSRWVNIIIVSAFTIVALLVGLIRTIVAWGLGLGATIAGGAGALAMVFSGVLLLLAMIALFWGNKTLAEWSVRARGNKEMMNAKKRAYEDAAKVVKAVTTTEAISAGTKT